MSNIQDNNQPNPPAAHGLSVEVQSHLDEEPDPLRSGMSPLPDGFADLLRRGVALALETAEIPSAEIEIAIVDDARIHELNRRHLNHDWETDVISFPYERNEAFVSGELIISWETACREAKETGWPALTELALYAIHGSLHLTGMDDQTAAERAEMREAERAVLEQLRPSGFERYDVANRGEASLRDGACGLEVNRQLLDGNGKEVQK